MSESLHSYMGFIFLRRDLKLLEKRPNINISRNGVMPINNSNEYSGSLYRFRRWEGDSVFAEDIIRNHRIYLSLASDNMDNDPNEFDTTINMPENNYEGMSISGDDSELDIINEWHEKDVIINQMVRDLVQPILNEETLLCYFTGNYDIEYMWENYGDSYKGICIEFQNLNNYKGYGSFLPVRYVPEEDRQINGSVAAELERLAPENINTTLCATKDLSYQNEMEIRYVVSKCRVTPISGRYYLEFPQECISRIFAGHNMSNEDFDSLQRMVEECLPDSVIERY